MSLHRMVISGQCRNNIDHSATATEDRSNKYFKVTRYYKKTWHLYDIKGVLIILFHLDSSRYFTILGTWALSWEFLVFFWGSMGFQIPISIYLVGEFEFHMMILFDKKNNYLFNNWPTWDSIILSYLLCST